MLMGSGDGVNTCVRRPAGCGVPTKAPTCFTDRMDPRVQVVLDGVERGDWDLVRQVLHPYFHWTQGETTTRGRTKVLALLADRDSVDPPHFIEVRDGQIYRWTT